MAASYAFHDYMASGKRGEPHDFMSPPQPKRHQSFGQPWEEPAADYSAWYAAAAAAAAQAPQAQWGAQAHDPYAQHHHMLTQQVFPPVPYMPAPQLTQRIGGHGHYGGGGGGSSGGGHPGQYSGGGQGHRGPVGPAGVGPRLGARGANDRRLSDHKIYTTSGVRGPCEGIIQKMQERTGALVVDVVGTEAIPTAVRVLAALSEAAQTQLGKHVTVQPFGAKEPLAFNVAFSVLPAPPARPKTTMRVSSKTEPKKLGRYLLEHVVQNRNSVVMEATGKDAIIAAMMGIGSVRSRINWDNLEDDLYCSVLPVERQESFESAHELTKNDKGEPLFPIKYFIALFPCARQKDNKPRRPNTNNQQQPQQQQQPSAQGGPATTSVTMATVGTGGSAAAASGIPMGVQLPAPTGVQLPATV